MSAGNDATVSAGNDVSVVAAQEGNDDSFKQKNKGGLFGKSTKESYIGATTTAVSSLVLAGERVIVEAGTGGAGDVALVGSRIEAGGDASLRAAGCIVIMPVRVLSYSKAESEESGFMGTGSSKLDKSQSVLNVRGEIEAGGKAEVRAGGDVAVQAARIAAGEDIEISA